MNPYEENMKNTMDVLSLYLNPQKVNIPNMAFNKKTEEKDLRENFIKMLLCQEDRYEEFIAKKGKNPTTKTKYDYIYDQIPNLMLLINKIFEKYRVHITELRRDPFPVDKYKFLFLFINFLNYDNECKKYLKALVKDVLYYEKFISRLNNFVLNMKNIYFHDGNTKEKLIGIIDDFIIKMEID